ncbi:hypothetical protein TNCV_3391551 [Trichonephila clavipes]|nr:hypothetical protein TNCV_3391551 [Trichonephila clavipes]
MSVLKDQWEKISAEEPPDLLVQCRNDFRKFSKDEPKNKAERNTPLSSSNVVPEQSLPPDCITVWCSVTADFGLVPFFFEKNTPFMAFKTVLSLVPVPANFFNRKPLLPYKSEST